MEEVMVVDWQAYDGFDWAGARQSPMTPSQRVAVVEMVADVLKLPRDVRGSAWGIASRPGRFAATVIRHMSGIGHCYQNQAAAAQLDAIAVKVFKTTADAQREAERIVPFHQRFLSRLPGLPNKRVQRSVAAGSCRDRNGEERAFVVLEWINGDSLEDLVRRKWNRAPIDGAVARSLMEQLFGDIVIPLWSQGTVWWDVRDANYCYSGSSGRLALIDADSLAAYATEILQTPSVWEKRDRGRVTALGRLRQMGLRILLAQGLLNKQKVQRTYTEIWSTELEPLLLTLGKTPCGSTGAVTALRQFCDRLDNESLFAHRSGISPHS